MEYLETIKKYVSGKQYASSNVQSSDGTIAYMTSTGVSKQYPSMEVYNATAGKNNCKSDFIQLTPNWVDLGFPVGSLMKSGQSCGNENTYVQATPPENQFDWNYYIQTYSDVRDAGITTETAALEHWNKVGKPEGRLPNATILSSMATLGKVGYIDVDATMHYVPPTYSGTFTSYISRSNVTGIKMEDCSRPIPPVNYGEQVILSNNNSTGFMNSSSQLEFGSTSTNLFLRPPVGNDDQGKPVKCGDYVSITTSASSYTSDCGWWGCKVGKMNPDTKQFEFGPGGENASTFRIMNSSGVGTPLKYGDPFMITCSLTLNKSDLKQDAVLLPGESIKSLNGKYMFIYQTDGNVCIYNTSGGGIWCSMAVHTPGKLIMQSDGNLVAYDSGGIPRWATNTWGQGTAPYTLTLRNDRVATVIDVNNTILWSTQTHEDTQETYSNTYTEIPGSDSAGYDIPGAAYGNAMVQDCKNTCNGNPDCAGFAFSNSTCYPKTSAMYPIGAKQTNSSVDIYTRDISSNQTTLGVVYVQKSTVKIGTFQEAAKAGTNAYVFSFKPQIPVSDTCDVAKLKQLCNDADCSGFVHSPATNSWQMITPNSSATDYTISSNLQDIYLKDTKVDLGDDSCQAGTPQFIDPTLFANYDHGEDFVAGGLNQCDVKIGAPQEPDSYKQDQKKMIRSGKKMVKKYKALSVQDIQKQNVATTQDMKTKTDEYKTVLGQIKKIAPSTTLDQQQTDMELFDKQNQSQAILWGILATAVLAIILLRPK
jgi:hypothetical protein